MIPKHVRIIRKLQEAKKQGALEIDLLSDEKSSNTRQIKFRIRRELGDINSLIVRGGKWTLDKKYWKTKLFILLLAAVILAKSKIVTKTITLLSDLPW